MRARVRTTANAIEWNPGAERNLCERIGSERGDLLRRQYSVVSERVNRQLLYGHLQLCELFRQLCRDGRDI